MFTEELLSSETSAMFNISHPSALSIYDKGKLDIKFKFIPMVLDALSSIELEYSPGDEFKYDIIDKAQITYELKKD